MFTKATTTFLCLMTASSVHAAEPAPRAISGVYPHLAMFNSEGECGTGAVVPWADRLWVITYGPHLPFGSSDKLYEVTPDLRQIIRPESVGGTPANRMIHRESQQLLMGPYLIDAQRQVRVIPPALMPGRLTGNARHLTDPAGKVYYATMEEGLYEVDLKSLAVTGLIKDGNPVKPGFSKEILPATLDSQLPGYHGKGLYSGQGRVVYANNGDRDKRVLTDPSTPSGALGEWTQPGQDWQLVRRNQFTEVTGPGGIEGSQNPGSDPIWSIGWDHRSLILMVLDQGKWHSYRLPKASHTYDGAHGWNTEWPRIRDIGEEDLLMTMHGAFWRFPKNFTPATSAGIAPRSTYLKVIGDFAKWNDRLVFGCDDTAKSEFLNKRKAKGDIVGPGRSQSNLWFVQPEALDHFGAPLGRGAVWLREAVKSGQPSEPYLFSGYDHRSVHLVNEDTEPRTFILEVDAAGDGQWRKIREIEVAGKGSRWLPFSAEEKGAWIRLSLTSDANKITAFFHYQSKDKRGKEADRLFDGLATPEFTEVSRGLIHARGADFKTLRYVDDQLNCYDLDSTLTLRKADDSAGAEWTRKHVAIPKDVLINDKASILYVDDKGRWRLPRGSWWFAQPGMLNGDRIDREVCTERDLFNAGGIFYELPAENAGGFAKIRPITTHNHRIHDYASYRGMLVMTGVLKGFVRDNTVSSEDGKASLWLGVVDDLWRFGKARGSGGPWFDTPVQAGAPSDPYLMTGFDRKILTLSHDATGPVHVRVEVDIAGTGFWCTYGEYKVPAGEALTHTFPDGFGAYWVRTVADQDCKATAQFSYE
ncbi:MAG TPA: hypothetical protein VD994_19490 [Prosthecobacter sp.]|nr:hypothetical protein [Prosthecobacter sp.]